jgi:hypothetical protein
LAHVHETLGRGAVTHRQADHRPEKCDGLVGGGRAHLAEQANVAITILNVSEESRHEFDFIFGRWHIHNRKLVDTTDPLCEEWVEFEASSEAFPVLNGFGHVDRMYVDDAIDIDPFEGFTLRLFDPSSGTWKIWWSSTRAPGALDPPVEGRFRDGHGIFECDDEIAGHPVVVRFEWLVDNPEEPRWQQSFSYDAGRTWKLNWTMAFFQQAELPEPAFPCRRVPASADESSSRCRARDDRSLF